MGEAKRRKASDPNYGKPKRGLVISSPIQIGPGNKVAVNGSLDLQELRASLLYWDRLAWPSNNVLHVESGPDAEFLMQAKVLTRPHIAFRGSGDVADVVARAHEQAFAELNESSPGVWSLAQGQNSLFLDHGALKKDEGIAVELLSAIPVPDKDVPLNDILEFRLKRYDELQALRSEIDSLVKNVNESGDPQGELVKCLKEIDEKSSAAIRVCSEWQFPVRLSSLKSSFDIKPFAAIRDGIGAYFGAHALGLSTAALMAAIGAHAVSSLKISGDFGWVGLKNRSNPYRYVSNIHNELF